MPRTAARRISERFEPSRTPARRAERLAARACLYPAVHAAIALVMAVGEGNPSVPWLVDAGADVRSSLLRTLPDPARGRPDGTLGHTGRPGHAGRS